MNYKPIIIINGEPNSIFIEIFLKSLKNKFKSPIILISSLDLLKFYMKKFNFKKKINIIKEQEINKKKLNNNSINLINVNYKLQKILVKFLKIKFFVNDSFKIALKIIKKTII